MLSILFDNGFSFNVDSVNEIMNSNGNTENTAELVMWCSLMSGVNAAEIKRNITAENMAHFVVKSDGEVIDEMSGFSVIRSITKILTQYERTLVIQATNAELEQ